MEYLDIVDENNCLTGDKLERKQVHEQNLFHRHVSCWIMNSKGEILLQRRAFTKSKNPGKWAKTGGHVDSGETVKQAVKREVYEEIGISISEDQMIEVEVFQSNKMNEHSFSHGFILLIDHMIHEFKLQEEEVSEVKYFTIEQLERYKEKNDDSFVFSKWEDEDFERQMKFLKQYRNDLLK